MQSAMCAELCHKLADWRSLDLLSLLWLLPVLSALDQVELEMIR